MTDRLGFGATEDRTLPTVVYVLYLLGLTHGLTILIGLIIAYANRDRAGPRMRTHYTWQIQTFWLSIVWVLLGFGLIIFGAPLSLILIGVPIVMLGFAILGVVWIWAAARLILGVIYLARDEPYPRPNALLL